MEGSKNRTKSGKTNRLVASAANTQKGSGRVLTHHFKRRPAPRKETQKTFADMALPLKAVDKARLQTTRRDTSPREAEQTLTPHLPTRTLLVTQSWLYESVSVNG